MGFSNEYLTEEEKKLIAETKHKRLTNVAEKESECLKSICTVDKDRKIWLMRYPRNLTFNPKLKEEQFVLFYGELNKNNLIEICLKDLGEEKDKSEKEKHGVLIIKYWSIKEIKIPSNLNVSMSDIEDILEELMTAYGISGNPEHKGPAFDGKFKAVIKEYK